jgi:hypothetical protein
MYAYYTEGGKKWKTTMTDFREDPSVQDWLNKEMDKQYPQGSVLPEGGFVSFAVGSERGVVMMRFPYPIRWLEFPPEGVIHAAYTLLNHARRAGHSDVPELKHQLKWLPSPCVPGLYYFHPHGAPTDQTQLAQVVPTKSSGLIAGILGVPGLRSLGELLGNWWGPLPEPVGPPPESSRIFTPRIVR